MSTWTSRYSEKWPRLTALFHLDGSTREGQDPNMRFEQPYPQDPDAYYKFYLHPDDIGRRSLSQYSVGGSDGKKGGHSETRASPIRVCLGAMLLFSLAGVVCVAVTLAVLLSQPHRLVYSTASPGNSTPYTSSFIAQKERQLQKEICGIMDTLFIFKEYEDRSSTKSCNISLKVEEGHVKINFKVPTPDKFVEEDMEKMKLRLLMNAKNAGLFNDLDDLMVDTMGQTVVIKDNVTSAVNDTLPFADDIIKLNVTEPATTEILTNHAKYISTMMSNETTLKTSTTAIPPNDTLKIDVLSKISESTTHPMDHFEHPLDTSDHDGIFSDQFVNDLLNMPLDMPNEEHKTETGKVYPDGHHNDTFVDEKIKKSDIDLLGDLGLSMEHLPSFFDSHIPDIHQEHTPKGIQEINDTSGHMLDNIVNGDLKNLHLDHSFSERITGDNPKLPQDVQKDRNESTPIKLVDPPVEVKSKVEMKQIKDSKHDKTGFWLTPEDLIALSEFNDPHAKLHLDDPHFHHDHSSLNLSASLDNDSVHNENISSLLSVLKPSPSIFSSDISSDMSVQEKDLNMAEAILVSSLDSTDFVISPNNFGDDNVSSTVTSPQIFVTASSNMADNIQPTSSYIDVKNDFKTDSEYLTRRNDESSKQRTADHSEPAADLLISSSGSLHLISSVLDITPFSTASKESFHLEPSTGMFEVTQSKYIRTHSFDHSEIPVSSAKSIQETVSVMKANGYRSEALVERNLHIKPSTSSFSSGGATISTSFVSSQNDIQMVQSVDVSQGKKESFVINDLPSRHSADISVTASEIQHFSKALSHNLFTDRTSSSILELSNVDHYSSLSSRTLESNIAIARPMDELHSSRIPTSVAVDGFNRIHTYFSSQLESSSSISGFSNSMMILPSLMDSSQTIVQESSIILSPPDMEYGYTQDSVLKASMSTYQAYREHDSVQSSTVLSSNIMISDSWDTITSVDSITGSVRYNSMDHNDGSKHKQQTISLTLQQKDSVIIDSSVHIGQTNTQIEPSQSFLPQHEYSTQNSIQLNLNSHIISNSESLSKSDTFEIENQRYTYNQRHLYQSKVLQYDDAAGSEFSSSRNNYNLPNAESSTTSVVGNLGGQQTTYNQIQPTKLLISEREFSTSSYSKFSSNSNLTENANSISVIVTNIPLTTESYHQIPSSQSVSHMYIDTAKIDIQPSAVSYILQSSGSVERSLNDLSLMERNKQNATVSHLETSLSFVQVTSEYSSNRYNSDVDTSSYFPESISMMPTESQILPSLIINKMSHISTSLTTEPAVKSLSSASNFGNLKHEFKSMSKALSEHLHHSNSMKSINDGIQNTQRNNDVLGISHTHVSNSLGASAEVSSSLLPLKPKMNAVEALRDTPKEEVTGTHHILEKWLFSSQDKSSEMPTSTEYMSAITPTIMKVRSHSIYDDTSYPNSLNSISTTDGSTKDNLLLSDKLTLNDEAIGAKSVSDNFKETSTSTQGLHEDVTTYTNVFTSTQMDGSHTTSHLSIARDAEFTYDIKNNFPPQMSSSVFEMGASSSVFRPSESSINVQPLIFETKESARVIGNEISMSTLQNTASYSVQSISYSSHIESSTASSMTSTPIMISNEASSRMHKNDAAGDANNLSTSMRDTTEETNNYNLIKPSASMNSASESDAGDSQSQISRQEYHSMNSLMVSNNLEVTSTYISSHHFTRKLSSISLLDPSMTAIGVDQTSLKSTFPTQSGFFSSDSTHQISTTLARYESNTSPTFPDPIMTSTPSAFSYDSESVNEVVVSQSYPTSDLISSSQVSLPSVPTSVLSKPFQSIQTQSLPLSYVSEYITTVPSTATVQRDQESLAASRSTENLNLQTAAFVQLNNALEAAPFEDISIQAAPFELKDENGTDTLDKFSFEKNMTTDNLITRDSANTVTNDFVSTDANINITTLRHLVSSSNFKLGIDISTMPPVFNSVTTSKQKTTVEKDFANDHMTDPGSNTDDTTLSTIVKVNVTQVLRDSSTTSGSTLKSSTTISSKISQTSTQSPVTTVVRNRITPNSSRTLLSQRQLQRLRARLAQLQALRGSRERVPNQPTSNAQSSRNGLRARQNRGRIFPNIPNTPIPNSQSQAVRRQPGSFINRNSVTPNRQSFVGTSRNVRVPSRSNIRNAQTAPSISNLRPPGRRRGQNPAQNGLLLFNLPGLDTNRFLGGANINWNRRFSG